MDNSFKQGDKVFAKVKGYPAWPAEVKEIKGKKYLVKFYGTEQIGEVKPSDLAYYLKNKHKKLPKSLKRKDLSNAVDEIEEAIKNNDGFDGESHIDDVHIEESLDTSSDKVKRRKRTISHVSNASSGTEKSLRLDNSESQEVSEMEITTESTTENITEENEEEEVNSNNLEETSETSFQEEDIDSSIKIISEQQLENYIKYAKHVKQNESFYKTRPVEPRKDYKNLVLPVTLPSKSIIGIKIHKTFPLPLFSNEFDRASYDLESATDAISLSESTKHSKTQSQNSSNIIKDLKMSEEEITKITNQENIERSQEMIKRLKMEGELIYIGHKIRNCLGLEKAEPKKAVELLQQMLDKQFDELMLKKHVHMVETIRRLRCYVGNSKDWNMSEEMQRNFEVDAKKVREVSEQVYEKMKRVLGLENSEDFWGEFVEKYNEFYKRCKSLNLKPEQIFVLCDEPYSRQAYLDLLNDELLM